MSALRSHQFLTNEDLHDLTGFKQPAAQEKYLRSKGYLFDCNARGVPRVLWEQVQARQTPVTAEDSKKQNADETPNAGALLRLVQTRNIDRKTVAR